MSFTPGRIRARPSTTSDSPVDSRSTDEGERAQAPAHPAPRLGRARTVPDQRTAGDRHAHAHQTYPGAGRALPTTRGSLTTHRAVSSARTGAGDDTAHGGTHRASLARPARAMAESQAPRPAERPYRLDQPGLDRPLDHRLAHC